MIRPLCIINFHGIGTPHADVGPDEARYWVTQDRFEACLDQAVAYQSGGGQIEITFDDGNRSDLDIACPALVTRGLRGHFFVLTGRLDDPRYLSADDIRTLQAQDMAIGLHGKDHVDWRKATTAGLQIEIDQARDTLSAIVEQPIDTVGLPFGGYDKRVIRYLRRAGFRRIYTSDGGHTEADSQLRHRTSLQAHMGPAHIEAILKDDASAITKVKRALKSWLKANVIG
jgi:peptidoglycan/xylan/chitin deacetylase (PgdA/CDA1 family)